MPMESLGNILITGFEPWGAFRTNPSGDVLAPLQGTEISGYRITTLKLKVDESWCRIFLPAAMNSIKPAAIISLGLDPLGRRVMLELDAHWHDNWPWRLQEMGREFKSTLPLVDIGRELLHQEVPTGLSCHAGSFACECVFYTVMGRNLLVLCSGFRIAHRHRDGLRNGDALHSP